MTEPASLAGGCLCGAIRYAIAGPVISCGVCHCVTCRRAAGAESVAWLTVAEADFRLTDGAPARFASSPGVERGFCARCGTSLTFRRSGEGSIDITVASLDDPEAAPVRSEVWLDHRLSWNPANPALRGYPQSDSAAS